MKQRLNLNPISPTAFHHAKNKQSNYKWAHL